MLDKQLFTWKQHSTPITIKVTDKAVKLLDLIDKKQKQHELNLQKYLRHKLHN